ncbi:MAG: osmotically inducible protein OsmC [Elusimicrobia bacterium]|nr:osmotically inducible protein OsmC [Elusimicrobiota bacterium]
MEILFPGGKKVHVKHRDFVIQTDQPLSGGGENSAPTPFDLFMAALASCAGFFVQDFVSKRGFPTDQLKMTARATRDEQTHLLKKLEIDITLPPGFPEKYRPAAIKAAELCLVARNLQAPPEITIKTI